MASRVGKESETSSPPGHLDVSTADDEGQARWGFQPINSWLAFSRLDLESSFIRERYSWVRWDEITFSIACLFGPSKAISWRNPDLISTIIHHTWVILSSCGFSGFCLYLMHKHRGFYRQHRLRLITILRPLIVIGGGLTFFVHDPGELWKPALLASRIFSQTPVTALFSTSLLVLPFKRHFWVQLVGASISWVWVENLCQACEASAEVDWAVNRIGWITEEVITRMAMFGFPVNRPELQRGQFPCWLVGLFYHFWLGFVIPCIACYVLELLARIASLRSRMGGDAERDLTILKVGRLLFVGLVSIVGTQVLWVVMKSLVGPSLVC
ncbi:hypothetical protein BSKO_00546 [Bryopsis sp. KO-2023]|nr:hypothetical protein BSKO_00546 [Bryopsis sp. KO-2023]